MATELVELTDDDPELVPVGIDDAPANGFEVVEVTRDEEGLQPVSAIARDRSLGEKLIGRFMGTDVNDPQELPRLGAMVAGGLGGGFAGSRVPKAPGPMGIVVNPVTGAVTFGLVGTLAGAVSPEVGMAVGEAFGFLPPGTREKLGLSPEELKTVLEGELLLELATSGGLSAVRLTGRGVSSLIAGVGKESKEAATRADALGIALLPVQVGKRSLARGYVAVMGRFPWFGTPIKRAAQRAENQAAEALNAAENRIGPVAAWNDIGEMIFRDASELVDEFNSVFRQQYEEVWQQADRLGVVVRPQATASKATEILEKIQSQSPVLFDEAGELVEGSAGTVLEGVRKFIVDEVIPMRTVTEDGVVVTAKQSFRQMDGLLTKIDQQIASLEPGQRKFAMSLYTQLRQAAQLDMLQNVSAKNAPDAHLIAGKLNSIDQNYSNAVSQLFETTAANRFGSVKKRGLRAFGLEESTRIPVDKLKDVVLKTDSPQMVEELSRLVSPETMQQITSAYIDEAYQRAFAGPSSGVGLAKREFRPEMFARQLGLDNLNSPKAKSLAVMLERSGSDLTVNDLAELTQAARVIAGSEIPDVSTFIARRATIGGLQSILSAVVPGIAMTGGVAAWTGSSLVAAAVVLIGGRAISKMISDPRNARFLKDVLDKEAPQLVRRNATLKVIRTTISAMKEDGDISDQEAVRLNNAATIMMKEMNDFINEQNQDDE